MLSVIVSTYNSPRWLEKVLLGLAQQDIGDFELLIADDGSGGETRALIATFAASMPQAVKHVWHPDEGFRKCEILNRAIVAASGDYLVLLDGDCIPRRDFLRQHRDAAEPGTFLTGGFVRMPLALSEEIDAPLIISGECFEPRWLFRNGLQYDRKSLRLWCPPQLAGLMDNLSFAPKSLKGGNSSFWRSDALTVNGFDHRMPWGGEDREFGVRLRNSGLRTSHMRYRAVILHLDHPRGYVDPAAVTRNRNLRQSCERNKISYTEHGIKQLSNTAKLSQHE